MPGDLDATGVRDPKIPVAPKTAEGLSHFWIWITEALAMAAGLTAPDPFSAPSLLVLKDHRDQCGKLNECCQL
jgi:hypothetical protein